MNQPQHMQTDPGPSTIRPNERKIELSKVEQLIRDNLNKVSMNSLDIPMNQPLQTDNGPSTSRPIKRINRNKAYTG